jgi:TolB protein
MSVLMDNQRDLFVVRPDGSGRRQITETPESELLATWSLDGRLAYVRPTDKGLRLIVMADPLRDGGQLRDVRLPGLSPAFTSAPWTPDGAALTVVAGEYPDVDIFRVPLDGSPPAPLVASPGYDGSPAWSRDGRLAFVSGRSGNRDIWVRDQEGTLHQLTTGAATDDNPVWSPDGRWIAFSSDRSGKRELHVVAAEGGSPTQITNNGARVAYPAWSPDGSMLAYVLVTSGRGNDQLMIVTVPAELRSR